MAVLPSTDATFAELVKSGTGVIVKYYADWCGSCKLISPKFKRLSEDSRFAGIQFLEVNAEENEEARKAAGVDNLPFFAVFKDGNLVRGTATSKEEMIVQLLESLKD